MGLQLVSLWRWIKFNASLFQAQLVGTFNNVTLKWHRPFFGNLQSNSTCDNIGSGYATLALSHLTTVNSSVNFVYLSFFKIILFIYLFIYLYLFFDNLRWDSCMSILTVTHTYMSFPLGMRMGLYSIMPQSLTRVLTIAH